MAWSLTPASSLGTRGATRLVKLLEEVQTIKLFKNDIAREGVQKDGKLPSGSVHVAEIYAALKDHEDIIVQSVIGRRILGDFKAIAVMERRDGWDDQYPDDLTVDDWEFETSAHQAKT